MAAIKTPFRYPGAKNKALPVIMEHLDPLLKSATEYCEPFVGGASVALEVAKRYANIKLYLNDKDYWVASFWAIVADTDNAKMNELLILMQQHPTVELFESLREEETTDQVRCAYKAIFFNRTAFSGILSSGCIGGREQKSKWTIDCRYNYVKLKAKILECHKLLAGRTSVSNKDVAEYAAIQGGMMPAYIDPPYYIKGAMLYPTNMQPKEHERLAKDLAVRPNWVLSYDDCSEIRELYKDKQIIDLASRYSINGKKSQWASKNELLILGD